MSQNRFSIPGQSETGLEPEPLQKREVPLFDLRGSLVPSSFTPRNDISSTIPVARLPDTLEGLVNSTPKGKDDKWTRDVQDLFSYHHLSYVYSRCLSPRGRHKKSNEDHPLWSELADELDAQPGLDYLQQGWTDRDPHPMAGLSTTFCDYRVELATNFKVLWEGNLYYKAVDFLLRFSFRLNLAPSREIGTLRGYGAWLTGRFKRERMPRRVGRLRTRVGSIGRRLSRITSVVSWRLVGPRIAYANCWRI